MNEERKQYLDLAKIIAMFLVAWGHLVGTSTYALEIPGVINGTLEEPLCPASSHGLWKLENFFYDKFGIQFAVVGVIIFFVISGYFIPDMQIKYGNDNTKISGLFLYCMKRIWPILWICVIVDGVFLLYVCGIRHSLHEYLATMTGVPFLFKQNSTIGVLCFLTTLIIMYTLSIVIRKHSLSMITCVYNVLLYLTELPLVKTFYVVMAVKKCCILFKNDGNNSD
ncbi:acyltransferase family protein [Butyrivibrio fibrisolvens]|uniref:acyltransferase family protein n=1 Tax=Butyrivibrio fibrisolvens TaxID=831 RepID=UPI0003B65DDA|nr:acyltransferase family protein [Butyrivibrio fibrisolvens]